MLIFNHSINLVTEIDANKAPTNILNAIANMPEETLNRVLIEAFIDAINNDKTFERLNENNSYATLKWGTN